MDMDLDHIWDLPIEHPPATTAGPSNQPLFIPSDDEGDVAATTQPTVNKHPDIDALFDGIDDLNESAPALDLDALRREADARNTRLVRAEISASIPAIQLSTTTAKSGGALDGIDGGDENGDGKKKRKPIAKLDEARLLGQTGLPQLVKDTKNFTPKGKGHEVNLTSLPSPPHSPPPIVELNVFCSRRFRPPIWTACSRCTNSGPTDCIRRPDSRRR